MTYEIVTSLPSNEEPIKINVKIDSIRETFLPNETYLYANGRLYIKIANNEYHLYHLFKEQDEKPTLFSNLNAQIIGAETTTPNYEFTHRLCLEKDDQNNYYAKPIFIGKIQLNKFAYSLDVDKIDNMTIDDTGFFISSSNNITKISDIYTMYNHQMYFKVFNYDPSIIIKVNDKDIKFSAESEYYTIDYSNDYNKINISGNDASPNQIILEVY